MHVKGKLERTKSSFSRDRDDYFDPVLFAHQNDFHSRLIVRVSAESLESSQWINLLKALND